MKGTRALRQVTTNFKPHGSSNPSGDDENYEIDVISKIVKERNRLRRELMKERQLREEERRERQLLQHKIDLLLQETRKMDLSRPEKAHFCSSTGTQFFTPLREDSRLSAPAGDKCYDADDHEGSYNEKKNLRNVSGLLYMDGQNHTQFPNESLAENLERKHPNFLLRSQQRLERVRAAAKLRKSIEQRRRDSVFDLLRGDNDLRSVIYMFDHVEHIHAFEPSEMARETRRRLMQTSSFHRNVKRQTQAQNQLVSRSIAHIYSELVRRKNAK
ncbi:hypothetical protein AB6A40_002588 [Gnathostoma spinigerum]|uniref:Uncharacterized protein n=1 Tax=Gnathostoma spinigerum TaxID=75299 RepID=A0ABD6ECJ6_9BILA